jgi:protein-tyrosine phosphatase
MRLAAIFSLMGIAWLCLAAEYHAHPWAWLCLWPGVSFLIVATAYGWFGAAVLGKRPDGTISPWVVVLLLPYFLLAWFAWTLHGWIARPERSHEIVPGLWVGRRARAGDLPEGIACVVDMTSEFWEPAAVRAGRTYLCLPTLDHHVPSEQAFSQLVRQVAELDRPVYVHCAHGYGRAAMFAAAVMIERGLASGLEDAEQILKQCRPKVHLARRQRELIRRVTRLKYFDATIDNASDPTGRHASAEAGPTERPCGSAENASRTQVPGLSPVRMNRPHHPHLP